MIWILVTVHILLAKSEELVGRRRWLSSYDKYILRTLEVLMYFLQGLMSCFCSGAMNLLLSKLMCRIFPFFCKLFSEG